MLQVLFKSCIMPCNACSELKLLIKRVKDVQFVVCLHIHPLADNTMNSKFFIMNSAFTLLIIQIFCSLYRQRVSVYLMYSVKKIWCNQFANCGINVWECLNYMVKWRWLEFLKHSWSKNLVFHLLADKLNWIFL